MRHDEIWRIKLACAIADFEDGYMSDDVFLACLKSAGFVGERLREEFRFHEMRRHEIKLKIA